MAVSAEEMQEIEALFECFQRRMTELTERGGIAISS